MANDITRRPWIIDTAGANNIYAAQIRLEQIQWEDIANTNDRLIIQDLNGNEIVNILAEGPNKTKAFGTQWINGLRVTQLDSGKLYIWIR